jgi:hypothetical protein
MCTGLHIKYQLFKSDFLTLTFLDRFSKNAQKYNLVKIRPVEAELLHADERPDRKDETNSRLSQFYESAQ